MGIRLIPIGEVTKKEIREIYLEKQRFAGRRCPQRSECVRNGMKKNLCWTSTFRSNVSVRLRANISLSLFYILSV